VSTSSGWCFPRVMLEWTWQAGMGNTCRKITDDLINFNGRNNRGHVRNEDIVVLTCALDTTVGQIYDGLQQH
jgi:hypothetical protein